MEKLDTTQIISLPTPALREAIREVLGLPMQVQACVLLADMLEEIEKLPKTRNRVLFETLYSIALTQRDHWEAQTREAEKLSNLKARHTETLRLFEEEKSKMSVANESHRELQALIDSLSTELEAKESDIAILKRSLQESNDENAIFHESITVLSAKLERAQEDITTEHESATDWFNKCNGLRSELSQLQSANEQLQKDLASAKSTQSHYLSRIAAFEAAEDSCHNVFSILGVPEKVKGTKKNSWDTCAPDVNLTILQRLSYLASFGAKRPNCECEQGDTE